MTKKQKKNRKNRKLEIPILGTSEPFQFNSDTNVQNFNLIPKIRK